MKYQYKGPMSGVTLADGTEVLLHDGQTVELPAEHEYTKTLLELGRLTPLTLPKTPANPAKGDH
jgi:hypothetical protein